MKKIAFFILITFCFCCGQRVERKAQVIPDRIEYVYKLKSVIDKNVWDGFNDKKFDVITKRQ